MGPSAAAEHNNVPKRNPLAPEPVHTLETASGLTSVRLLVLYRIDAGGQAEVIADVPHGLPPAVLASLAQIFEAEAVHFRIRPPKPIRKMGPNAEREIT